MGGSIDYLIILGSVGNFICVGIFGYFNYASNWRRALAHQGDLSSAGRLLLPCYRPIFRWMMFVYFIFGTGMALSLMGADSVETQFYVLQLYSLMLLGTFMIAPLLLIQSSISYNAMLTCAAYISPWYILCITLWAISHPYHRVPSWKQTVICFWVFACVPPILLGLGLVTRIVQSRIVINSCSNRAAIDHMLFYAVFFITSSGASSTPLFTGNGESQEMLDISIVVAVISFFLNQVFPWALYRTLLADTKYWRGLGRHNDGFVAESENQKTGSITTSSIFKPGVMDIRLVTHDLQSAMADMQSIVVDFALLNIKKRIGEGAHAHVYSGLLRQEPVAVKVFVPTEVNQEVIKEFLREAKLSKNIRHKNVVQFGGVCVRPPQIAMVMEFCEGGNLKTNILKNKEHWTGLMRANACFDAAMAVEYLHKSGYIHRDIKAENFLVVLPIEKRDTDRESTASDVSTASTSTRRTSILSMTRRGSMLKRELPSSKAMGRIQEDFIVKLGDFGESCKKRVREDGTVVNVRNSLMLRPIARGDSWRDGTEDMYGDFEEEGMGSMLSSMEPSRMSIKGTAGYMAPELVSAAKVYNESVDIYALGVTFWEIWTGSDPYEGLSVFKVHEMVEKGVRPDMPASGNVPEGMQRIINECWAQSAGQRATASELLSMIEGFIMEEYGVDNSYRYTYGDEDADEITNRLSKSQSGTGIGIRQMTKNAVKSMRRQSRSSISGMSSFRDSTASDSGSPSHASLASGPPTPVFRSLREIDRVPSPMASSFSEGASERSEKSLGSEQSFTSALDEPISPMHVQDSLEAEPNDSDDSVDEAQYDSPRPSRAQLPVQYPKDSSPQEERREVKDKKEKDTNDGDDVIRNSTLANAGAMMNKGKRGSILGGESSSSGKLSETGIRKKRSSVDKHDKQGSL